jgi:hypothetical protein
LADRFHDFLLQYFELSAPLEDTPERLIARKRLEQQLQKRCSKGQTVERWDCPDNLIFEGSTHGQTDLADQMVGVADKVRVLHRRGLDVLVIDTVTTLPQKKLPQLSAALRHVWQSGVEIVLRTENHIVFFDDMRELVTTSDFIDIYVKSMWVEHIRNSPDQVARYATSLDHY